MVIKRTSKKIRCEMRGCRGLAVAGIGPKGVDFFLCKQHLEEVRDGAIVILRDIQKEMLAEQRKASKAAQVNEIAEAELTEATPVEEVTVEAEAAPAAEVPAEEPKEDSFHCKWCGEDIPKRTMTANEFARHSKECKKAHNGVPFGK